MLKSKQLHYTLCSQFMRFRIMRFSIYAVLENGPNSCFMLQYSHIMRFLVKIIVYKILLIFFLHLCYSCIMRFLLGNKKRINGELSVFYILAIYFWFERHRHRWCTHFSALKVLASHFFLDSLEGILPLPPPCKNSSTKY